MSLPQISAYNSIRSDDAYIKRVLENNFEKLAGTVIGGSCAMLASRIYVADNVCEGSVQFFDCVGYVITSWALMGGIVGRKAAPSLFEVGRKICTYATSFFPTTDRDSNV